MFFLDLKPHIKRELQVLQPINLMYAIDFAKLEEEKYLEIHKYQIPSTSTYSYLHFQSPSLPSAPSFQPLLSKPTNNSYKKLSPNELQERREKDLCHI